MNGTRINTGAWLDNRESQYTLTPSKPKSGVAQVYSLSQGNAGLYGEIPTSATYTTVRPVINLLPGTMISGGNGTSSNPYIVV